MTTDNFSVCTKPSPMHSYFIFTKFGKTKLLNIWHAGRKVKSAEQVSFSTTLWLQSKLLKFWFSLLNRFLKFEWKRDFEGSLPESKFCEDVIRSSARSPPLDRQHCSVSGRGKSQQQKTFETTPEIFLYLAWRPPKP